MSRIAYVNGRYVPHREATVHIEDRGYQFADGVYEVIAVRQGRPVDESWHLDRLQRSLDELRMAPAMGRRPLGLVIREVARRNGVDDGIVYVQMTRGVAPRNHAFPDNPVTQLVITARRGRPAPAAAFADGVRVITLPDLRWGRCDIKSIALLPNVLAKQQAREAGAFEAWLIDRNGMVTEGTSTNAWIVSREGQLITRHADRAILAGITRRALIGLAREARLALVERPFSAVEAKAAREAFVTSTSQSVVPVTQIDDQVIGNGKPGTVSLRLRELHAAHVELGAAGAAG